VLTRHAVAPHSAFRYLLLSAAKPLLSAGVGLWGYWNRTMHKIVYADAISLLRERQ